MSSPNLKNDIMPIPYKIRHYKFLRLIQSKSYNQVFFAKSTFNNQIVIIKMIKRVNQHYICNNIESDIKIPLSLDHDNIMTIIDYFHSKSYSYIIYPYKLGTKTMVDIICQRIDYKDIKNLSYMINLLMQITNAINYMHNNKVIHGDIKPHNIIINDNIIKIIDFDRSFFINHGLSNMYSRVIGTPRYSPPETWKNISLSTGYCELSGHSYIMTDIYAFGVSMFNIFNSGKFPYSGKSIDAIRYSVLHKKPLVSNSGILEIDNLIMKMINKMPSMRPSLTEIYQYLENMQKNICHI